MLKRLISPFAISIIIIICIKLIFGVELKHVMGPLWFLLALFWAKIIFEFIKPCGKWSFILGLFIGLLGWIASMFFEDNRLFILQGLCAMPFITIGYSIKQKNIPLVVKIICVICWPLTIFFSHLEMRSCEFGCWPLDILGACGATYLLFKIIDQIVHKDHISVIGKFMTWCGKYSLAIMCMSTVETKALLPLEEQICGGYLLLLIRFFVTMLLSCIVVYTPLLKKVYA